MAGDTLTRLCAATGNAGCAPPAGAVPTPQPPTPMVRRLPPLAPPRPRASPCFPPRPRVAATLTSNRASPQLDISGLHTHQDYFPVIEITLTSRTHTTTPHHSLISQAHV